MLECKTDYDVVFQDAIDAFSVAYLRQQRGGSPVGQLAGEYFSVTWKVGEKLLLLIQAPDEAVFVSPATHRLFSWSIMADAKTLFSSCKDGGVLNRSKLPSG